MHKREDNSQLFTTETLRGSLERGLKGYWKTPSNRKIEGQLQGDILDDIYIQDIDYFYILEGKEVSQFELLLEALDQKKKLPKLQGRFQVNKVIANGTATRSINCHFELLGNDYDIENDGCIVIRKLLIQTL